MILFDSAGNGKTPRAACSRGAFFMVLIG